MFRTNVPIQRPMLLAYLPLNLCLFLLIPPIPSSLFPLQFCILCLFWLFAPEPMHSPMPMSHCLSKDESPSSNRAPSHLGPHSLPKCRNMRTNGKQKKLNEFMGENVGDLDYFASIYLVLEELSRKLGRKAGCICLGGNIGQKCGLPDRIIDWLIILPFIEGHRLGQIQPLADQFNHRLIFIWRLLDGRNKKEGK